MLTAVLIIIEVANISQLNIPLGKHFIEKWLIVYLFISTVPPLLFKGRIGGLLLVTDTLTAIGAVFLSPSPIMPFLAGLPLITGALLLSHSIIPFFTGITFLGVVLGKFHHLPENLSPLTWNGTWQTIGVLIIWSIAAIQSRNHMDKREERDVLVNLIKVSQELGSTLNLNQVSNIIIDISNTLFTAGTIGFYIIKKEEDRAILHLQRIVTPFKNCLSNISLEINQQSAIIEAVHEKKSICIGDIHQTNDMVVPKIKEFHSMLVAPIIFENEPLGIIFIINAAINAYSKEDAVLLGMLANQIAICLKNVHLYETTAQMAITDSLTGLYCHGYFQDYLIKAVPQAKQSNKHLSMLIIDVDFFKQINDTYGHPQGDYILRQLAGIMKITVRKEDIPSRYGGDEFTICMPGLDRMAASVAAERIRKEVEEYQFMSGTRGVRITLSIGIASFPESAQTSKDLIAAADEALYEAKHRGRNQVVFR